MNGLQEIDLAFRLLICALILAGWVCTFLFGFLIARFYHECAEIAATATKTTAPATPVAPLKKRATESAVLLECERVAAAYARRVHFDEGETMPL